MTSRDPQKIQVKVVIYEAQYFRIRARQTHGHNGSPIGNTKAYTARKSVAWLLRRVMVVGAHILKLQMATSKQPVV